MVKNTFYPIGLHGVPWKKEEKDQWLHQQIKSRSYQDDVVTQLTSLSAHFDLIQYGELSEDPAAYPLFALKTNHWDPAKPIILITGGVHGYETSGVHGALQFMTQLASHDSPNSDSSDHSSKNNNNNSNAAAMNQYHQVNIVALPCISPWGYEHIVRWNPNAVDPNRSFINESPSEEASLAMKFVASLNGDVLMHIDLHETTDSDETEFRPALVARDGGSFILGEIPDGFYLVGDSHNKQADFQTAILKAVRHITHIAPADEQGDIIGSKAEKEGLIYYPVKTLGLCAGMTNATYTTTTEVYPDSPHVTDADCNKAQVTAIEAALAYVIKAENAY